jgi:hypothetical protein
MPIAPPATTPTPLSFRVLDIIVDALIEIGMLSPGEEANLEAEVAQWAFRKFNYLTDIFAAKRAYVYSYSFSLYTLVPALSPHTIGPSGTATFDTSPQPRPVKIESAAQILNNSSQRVDLPINIRDAAWWAANQTKEIDTNVVTDLFYDPTNPDGSLYFWPVPNEASQVRLQLWQTVSQFSSIQDPIGGPGGPGTLPQAYRAALMLTLAETLLPGAKREAHPSLTRSALEARTALLGNNNKSPRISTQDSGMPRSGGRGVRGDFNWVTGGAAGGPPE